eukprot:scaffold22589_cov138-Cylindrotheca_fusiformis.AAC.34
MRPNGSQTIKKQKHRVAKGSSKGIIHWVLKYDRGKECRNNEVMKTSNYLASLLKASKAYYATRLVELQNRRAYRRHLCLCSNYAWGAPEIRVCKELERSRKIEY